MILSRFIGEAVAFVIGEFGCTAASSELNSEIMQEGQGVGVDAISRVGETLRFRDAVLDASIVDRPELFGE